MVGAGRAFASRVGAIVPDASCELRAATVDRGQEHANCKQIYKI